MGQTLSEPVTLKNSSLERNAELLVGASAMQGWRVHMEDAHTTCLALPTSKRTAYFGLFDGHGGAKIARYAAKNLHQRVVQQAAFRSSELPQALEAAFLELDAEMRRCKETREEMSGSTALVLLLQDSALHCANAGDSRAVLCVSGKAVALSSDHKPHCEPERARIRAAGGWVAHKRVNGNLALSRALGDFAFKKNRKRSPAEQIVTAKPDVTSWEVTEEFEFAVMACDGIWDVLTNQEVVNFVRARLAQAVDLDVICEDLMTHCLAPDSQTSSLGCDNMTVIIVAFLHQRGAAGLFKACATLPKAKTPVD